MWEKIKDWLWAVVLGIVALLAILFTGKPRWVRETEKNIKERDKQIADKKTKAGNAQEEYEKAVKEHDDAIEEAGKAENVVPFDDPDDAAGFLDDILERRKRR